MAIRTILLFVLVGIWMAGSIGSAALVAGKRSDLDRWALGGFLWGAALALFMMVDCFHPWPGWAGRFASLLYLGGLIGALVGLHWQTRPSWRWLWTVLLTGLTLVPFFLLSVVNALCHLT